MPVWCCFLPLSACDPGGEPVAPTPTITYTHTGPGPTPTPWLVVQEAPGGNGHPTLADFWEGRAEFVVEVEDTGLPRGESETIVMGNGELWSYLHASERSAGAVDQCGDPVEFPGCTVIYKSYDGGYTFQHDDPPVCQFECRRCPCDPDKDHVVQQQYPRVAYDGETMILVYEYLGRTMLRRSDDGLSWSKPQQVDETGIWKLWLDDCAPGGAIGEHPFVRYDYECLAGGPPGVYVEGETAYVFVGLGQNPGGMGCYSGSVTGNAKRFKPCAHNPLFVGAGDYGPLEEKGPQTNPYFDFRMISSAEVVKVGERYYMLYEGIRGPGARRSGRQPVWAGAGPQPHRADRRPLGKISRQPDPGRSAGQHRPGPRRPGGCPGPDHPLHGPGAGQTQPPGAGWRK